MIKSMTGYGTAKGTVGNLTVTVEIRSLNSKFLELNLKLPYVFREKELELRADLNKLLERGKADVSISVDNNELSKKSSINKEIFKAYYDELKQLSLEVGAEPISIFSSVLQLPSVLTNEKSELDALHFAELKELINQAVIHFNSFRANEGLSLEKDIRQRVDAIANAIIVLETMEQPRIDAVRARMQKGINDLKEQTSIDQNRFEQELIYYIEKLDISEEKVRLRSHCEYFNQTIASNDANGKKLGFITQEIGREINTIGSKANDAIMQRTVVEMKDELEKMKEQLANIL